MKKICAIMLLSSFISNGYSQTGWQQLTDYDDTYLSKIIFLNENTGFAVGSHDSYLICKTTNGGLNWNNTYSGFSTLELFSICFIDNNTGFTVGGSLFELQPVFLKTTNLGNSWQVQTLNGFEDFTLFDIKFINQTTGYISGTGGLILKTTNGGNNWIQQYTGVINQISRLSISTDNQEIIYGVGSNSFVLKSTNAGINWQSIDFPVEQGIRNISFLNSNTGYVAGQLYDYPYTPVLYKTTDQGNNWNNLTSSLPSGSGGSRIFFNNVDTGFFISSRIYKTTNAGLNWRPQESYYWNTNYYDIFFLNNNLGFITCSWQSIYNGIILKTINGGDSPPNPPTYLYCSRTSQTNRLTWVDNSVIETGFVIQRQKHI